MNSVMMLSDSAPIMANGSQLFLAYLFMFLTGDLIGYGIEVLFRRIFTVKKWVNPGFMKGPWLPLYGFGLMLMFTFDWVLVYYLPKSWVFYNPLGDLFSLNYVSGATVYDLVPILIMGFSLILLEFIAGLIFVRGFKVRLWDYSNIKGNILGIVCPMFDVLWFVVAIIYYYGLSPFVYEGFKNSFAFMFNPSADGKSSTANVIFIFFLGVIYGVMLLDFINSLGIFGKITSWAKKSGIEVRYEKMREEQKDKLSLSKKAFLASLPSPIQKGITTISNAKKESQFVYNFKKKFFIDPDKNTKDNFGQDNRPVKTNEKEDALGDKSKK
jgi:uncharacterized membrane protein